jgi:hypothetical protein
VTSGTESMRGSANTWYSGLWPGDIIETVAPVETEIRALSDNLLFSLPRHHTWRAISTLGAISSLWDDAVHVRAGSAIIVNFTGEALTATLDFTPIISPAAHTVVPQWLRLMRGARMAALDVPEPVAIEPEETSGEDVEPVSFAFSCVNDLVRWLEVGVQPLLAALDIPRQTYYAWGQRHSTPRPGTTKQLYRLHSLVSLAVDTLGENGARGWLHTGTPTWQEKLLAAAADRAKLARLSDDLQLLLAPVTPPPVDLTVTVRRGRDDGEVPDTVPEGW